MMELFFLAFLVALTGALAPGPLLTFTIYKSVEDEKRGYLVGFFVILGHATLEICLILLLLMGISLFLQNILILTVIGVVGGILLMIFGMLVIYDVKKKDMSIEFSVSEEDVKGFKGNAYLGGILVSLSNPYWILWWAIVGLSFMINFNVGFDDPLRLFIFFLGHELGDLVWYVPVSILAYFGGKSLNPKIFKYILFSCGLFMICFGIYLALNILIFPPDIS